MSLAPAEIVTGERLRALADATLLPAAIASRLRTDPPSNAIRFHQHRDIDAGTIERLSACRSLFVYTHALALFRQHVWPRLTGSGYVLITHNSDYEVGPEEVAWAQDGRLEHWFAQNLLVEDPKVTPLPIGIANSAWEHGDVEVLCAATGSTEPRELLYAGFESATHPDRERAREAVGASLPERSSFADYLAELARHRFCICPRGNGIDTHRFWECQYLGVVPVVERSEHTEMWRRQGLPMVALDDWSELTPERLEADVPDGTAPALRLSHYAKLIGP